MATEEYTPTSWVDDGAPDIDASNLNHIELGIKAATDGVKDLEEVPATVVPIGGIIIWYGLDVPPNWAVCDGNNGTPDLRFRFLVMGTADEIGDKGGTAEAIVVEHTHPITVNQGGNHSHKTTNVFLHDPAGQEPVHSPSLGGGTSTSSYPMQTDNSGTHDHPAVCTSEGDSGIGMNLPPYHKILYIMRIA